MGRVKNMLFGGEGLVLAKMRGPGKVYMQSLPFSRLVDRITFPLQQQIKGLTGNGDE